MQTLSPTVTDPVRLQAVHDVLRAADGSGRTLDHLALLASEVLRAPMALITLVDSEREVLEGSAGLSGTWKSEGGFPLDYSFCKHLVATGQPLLLEDARTDDRVRANPAVQEMNVIAYAGVPLTTREGQVLGAVCVIDHLPRSWAEEEVKLLARIADAAREEIEQNLVLRRERDGREEAANRFQDTLAEASRFRLLVENSLAGIYLLQDDRVLYVNPRGREIFGYTPEESLSHVRLGDLVAEEDRARVLDNVRRQLAGEPQVAPFGFRGRRKNGQAVDVEVLGSRTEVEDRPAVIGTLLDVTERRRAEEQLQRAAERLRLVERATEDVIWEWNARTGEVTWNEAGRRLFRYRAEEVGSTIEWHLEHIHPEDRERVLRSLHATLNGVGEFWSQEYRFRRGDGLYVIVLDRGYVQRNGRGEAAHVTGVMMDVTERKQEEEAQRLLSEASAVLDSSMDPASVLTRLARLCVPRIGDYCMIDLRQATGDVHRIATSHIDPGLELLLLPGAAGDERRVPEESPVLKVLETGEHVFVPACDDAKLEAMGYVAQVRKAILGPERSSLILVPISLGEQALGVLTLGTCSPERQLTPLDVMLLENLARRVALAVDRARLYEQAQAAVRARDEILGVVSHDLRNPLSTIQITAALLHDLSHERRDDNRKWLEVITRSVKQMNSLIEDLLDVTSIEAGGFSVETAESDVRSLVRDACEMLAPLARKRKIRLETSVADDLPPMRLDAPQVLRVISNLVGNALKFTPGGGRVVLRAEQEGEAVVFAVTDTGPGIPEDQLPHVFDRFWQARPGDRRGAGLGLTIAKGIVEAHGGRIWAESRTGEGATFRFTLPVTRGAAV
jgi:PAS domain S-box-containing protein